jgi:DNA-binding GntR family transcriptional regulator
VLRESRQREALWDEHEKISRAIARGDADRAAALIEHHAPQASENLLARLADVLHRQTRPPPQQRGMP